MPRQVIVLSKIEKSLIEITDHRGRTFRRKASSVNQQASAVGYAFSPRPQAHCRAQIGLMTSNLSEATKALRIVLKGQPPAATPILLSSRDSTFNRRALGLRQSRIVNTDSYRDALLGNRSRVSMRSTNASTSTTS